MAVILEEQSFDFYPQEDMAGLYAALLGAGDLIIGKSYNVTFDNKSYTCVAEHMVLNELEGIGIGNKSIVGIGDDTQEPFIIGCIGQVLLCVIAKTDITSYRIRIDTYEQGVLLKDWNGKDIPYEGVNFAKLRTTDGGTQLFSKGVAKDNVPITLDFSNGDQTVVADDGTLIKSATIKKPENFLPENIKKGEIVAGVEGTHEGSRANLIPLTVTENGTYYPTGSLEVGQTYTLRNDYSQAELQALYEISPSVSEDGMYAQLLLTSKNNATVVGIMYYAGGYGVFLSDGHIWLPEEFTSQMGLTAGWNFGFDLTNLTPAEIPSITLEESWEGIAEASSLFELGTVDGFSEVVVDVSPALEELIVTENGIYEPTDSDGYSKVVVSVASRDTGLEMVQKSGTYTADTTNAITVTHNLGILPDIIMVRGNAIGTQFNMISMVSMCSELGGKQTGMFWQNSTNVAASATDTDIFSVNDTTMGHICKTTENTFQIGGIFFQHKVGSAYSWTVIGGIVKR